MLDSPLFTIIFTFKQAWRMLGRLSVLGIKNIKKTRERWRGSPSDQVLKNKALDTFSAFQLGFMDKSLKTKLSTNCTNCTFFSILQFLHDEKFNSTVTLSFGRQLKFSLRCFPLRFVIRRQLGETFKGLSRSQSEIHVISTQRPKKLSDRSPLCWVDSLSLTDSSPHELITCDSTN